MITEITDNLTVVFDVRELCFVPEFDDLWNAYGQYGMYVLILYAHPGSPYGGVLSKRDRLYLIITDTSNRFSEMQKRDIGFYKADIEDFMGSVMEAAITKYKKLLPTTDPVVVLRIYQEEIGRILETIRDTNMNSGTGIKELRDLIQIEKSMTLRIEQISKTIAKRYMNSTKTGQPSSLVQDIQNMTAASKRK